MNKREGWQLNQDDVVLKPYKGRGTVFCTVPINNANQSKSATAQGLKGVGNDIMKKLEALDIEIVKDNLGEYVALYINDDVMLVKQSREYEMLLYAVYSDDETECYFSTISDLLNTIEHIYEGFIHNWGECYDALYALKFGVDLTKVKK